jgi:glyoxylase-like metal-dependent hydrolase (beta-lactamase superfamily II)
MLSTTVVLGKRTLTVLHTPGHSPGGICLLDRRDGILFTGDTFYPGMLYAHSHDSHFGRYLRSLRDLVGILEEVDCLCPAHNEACTPKMLLVQALEAFESIRAGETSFDVEGETRVYQFDRIGVTLPLAIEDQ